jgi:hypothetical protein
LHVDLFEDDRATGLELIVQLKATDQGAEGDAEPVRLASRTYNYLMGRLQVAMLAKFVEADQEAYWILLRDVPPPPEGQDTFTVQIPKANRLSTIRWEVILDLIKRVTDAKRAAARAEQLQPRI